MFQSVLERLRERQTAELEGVGEAEAGFTLIELMVVLLIIAILLAIAIPTFLGVKS
jgi:type IV pilus assembly protein PilA